MRHKWLTIWILNFLWLLVGLPIVAVPQLAAQTAIEIQVANQAGVAGYQITIFGSGFGEATGRVVILGKSAEITYWTPTAVQAIVPSVNDGSGELVVTSDDGQTTRAPFTVYSINPDFLQPPTQTYQNILTGRQAILSGVEWSYCQAQPTEKETEPELFLSNYRCGYDGVARSGLAVFWADSSREQVATIAYQFSEPLQGEYRFQFITDNVWYVRQVEESYLHSVPHKYVLEISADSTDGTDGNWQPVFTVEGNVRSSRLHTFHVPDDSNATWFRMRVTDGLTDHTEPEGRDFAIRTVRLLAATGDPERPDAAAIYGDSLTADAFESIGFSGLPAAVRQLRDGTNNDLLFVPYGLSGQNGSGLVAQDEIAFDIYDALALDDAEQYLRYWFIAIGTNDAADGAAFLNTPSSNLYEYPQRLDNFVSDAIERGLVPIVARVPDTNDAIGNWGDVDSKRHVLNSIDAVAARYQLIPGPDLYADFRLNLETDEGSYYGEDGVHHVIEGGQRLIEAWAEAYVGAGRGVDIPELVRPTDVAPPATATPGPTLEPTLESTRPIYVTIEAFATQTPPSDDAEPAIREGSSTERTFTWWQAALLFAVLVLICLGFVLFLFKQLELF